MMQTRVVITINHQEDDFATVLDRLRSNGSTMAFLEIGRIIASNVPECDYDARVNEYRLASVSRYENFYDKRR